MSTVFKINLDKDPNLVHHDWFLQIIDHIKGICTSFYDHGCHHLALTPAQFDIIYPGEIFPPPSELPAALGANATSAQTTNHLRLTNQHVAITKDIKAATQSILDSLGEDNIRLISDPITGTSNVNILVIVTAMNTAHGTPTESTIDAWQAALKVPHAIGHPFSHTASIHRHYHACLLRAGSPEPERTKLKLLEDAIKMHIDYTEAFKDYNKANPVHSLRTFDGAATFVQLHAPNITTGVAGYANATMSPAQLQQLEDNIFNRMNALSQHGHAGGARATAFTGRAYNRGAGRGVSPVVGRGRGATRSGTTSGARNYCYLHGYDGHKGAGPTGCRGMAAANLATPGTYSQLMLNATDHLSGGSRYNL